MTTPVLSVVDKLPAAVANREAVEMLESFLADAKTGRIVTVALAAVTNQREYSVAATSTDDRTLLLGALHRLAWKINAQMDVDAGERPNGTGGAA